MYLKLLLFFTFRILTVVCYMIMEYVASLHDLNRNPETLRLLHVFLSHQLYFANLRREAETVPSFLRFPEHNGATLRDQWVTDMLIMNCPLCN